MAFCGIAKLELIIEIDTSKAEKAKREVILSKLYYQPNGFFQTAEKMKDACEKAGYNFSFVEILKWYKN